MPAPWIANSTDGFRTASGTPTTNSGSIAPVNSGFNNTGVLLNATGEAVLSPQQPARTSGGAGIAFTLATAGTAAGTFVEWRDAAGNARLRLRVSATGTVNFEYWTGSWTSLGTYSTVTVGDGLLYRLAFAGLNTASGSLSLKVFGVGNLNVVLGTIAGTGLDLSSISDISYVYAVGNTSNNAGCSLAYLCDQQDDVGLFVYSRLPNANGTDTGASSGSFADLDETNSDPDADAITLTNSGDRHSVKFSARSLAGRGVRGLCFNFRLRCGVTGPNQCKLYVKIGGTRYYWGGGSGTVITLTTSYVAYPADFENNPAAMAAWANAVAEDANLEAGVEVV